MFTVIVNSSGLSLLFTCGTDDRHAVYTRTSINEAWWCQCVCAFVRKNTGWPRAYPTHGSFRAHAACNSNRRIQGRALTQQFRR